MASIYRRNRGKNWYISYLSNGKRVIRSLKTSDERLARHLKQELEVEIRKGTHQEAQRLNIDAFFEEYLKDTTHRKKTTNRNELYTVKEFLRSVGKRTINGFNFEDVRSFLCRYEKKAPKTYNFALGAIHRFFRPAVEKGYILKNPCRGIHRKKLPQALPRFFTDEEYLRIEKAAEGHPIFPMVVTARYTGLRLRELINLEWQDFDWERKIVKVLNKPNLDYTVKNYQVRIVPISDELRDKLLPYIKKDGFCFPIAVGPNAGSKYSDNGPKRPLKNIFKNAGIDKGGRRIGWHEFRHTFASRLVQNNVSINKVCKWLGHSSITVTQIYAHFAPTYDQDIEKLSLDGTAKNPINQEHTSIQADRHYCI